MQHLVEYVSRCPFSLSRMVSLTRDGKILYRASHANCLPFPLSGDKTMMKGIPRNFEVYEPLDFLAEVTQHIPNKGDHQIHYFGWYSNKKRGMRQERKPKAERASGSIDEPDTPVRRRMRMTWPALIKCVYEVDPLKCSNCGATMKVISFIERTQPTVIEKILRHCGLWKEAPPKFKTGPPAGEDLEEFNDPPLDYEFFAQTCI